MNIWMDYAVKQEQRQDWLREAEKERLIRQIMAECKKSVTWQSMKDLMLGITKRQPASQEAIAQCNCLQSLPS